MRRYEAIQSSWRRARMVAALHELWDDAAERLNHALDADLEYVALMQFAALSQRLSAAIGNREPLLRGAGLTLYAAVKVADEVLRTRDEMVRRDEVLHALVTLDALDDDEEVA